MTIDQAINDGHEFLKVDGHDAAFIGIVERFGQEPIACYDKDKIIQALAKDMGEEDAEEYFQFNIIGAYVGELTPCFLT